MRMDTLALGLLCAFTALTAPTSARAQDKSPGANTQPATAPASETVKPADPLFLREIGDGLYTLEVDSTNTKCTVVEFDDSIALIEVALSKEGGGARELREHREGGEAVLRLLRERFPTKPLAAVLHSHWHPHSLASVGPFLEAGIPLVTTRANFARVRAFVDTALVEANPALVRYVDGDSLVVGRGPNAITAYRLKQEDYSAVPTEDYLFFHIPGQRALQCGCMYSKWRGEPVAGRAVFTGREQDLHRFITEKGLPLDTLIRLNREPEETGQMLAFAGLDHTARTGVTTRELAARFTALSTDSLRLERDRLVRDALADNVPGTVLNSLVYQELNRKDLARAKEFAVLQAMLTPSSANAWDTLGEVHYFLGELAAARAYEKHARKIDPEFTAGGEAVWEKDLADFKAKWAGAP